MTDDRISEIDTEFAEDWDPEVESVTFHGPFPVPGLCEECQQRQHSP